MGRGSRGAWARAGSRKTREKTGQRSAGRFTERFMPMGTRRWEYITAAEGEGRMEEVMYYLADGGVRRGPFRWEELAGQNVRATTLVWREGMAEWVRAAEVPEVSEAVTGLEEVKSAASVRPRAAEAYDRAWADRRQAFDEPGVLALAYTTMAAGEAAGTGVAALVLGIVGLVFSLVSVPVICLWAVALPCDILGVVLGGVGRRRRTAGRGMALAGIICGGIGILIFLAEVVVVISMAWGRGILGS
jgi:hypothetical protein